MEQEKLWGADRSFYHTLIQLSMNMNVDIHLINRLNVGCQSVSRAITLTSDDKYWCGVEIVDSCSVFSGRATQRRTTPLPTQKIAWVVLLTTLSQAVQRLPANSLACNVTRRTPDTKICRGRRSKRVSKLLRLNVKNTYFSESLISVVNYCLTTPNELTNFHILEFNLKQFKAFGNEHL